MRSPTNSYFRVKPGQTIKFYVNRHASLSVFEWVRDWNTPNQHYVVSSVEQIANNQVQAVEVFTAGMRCPDYWLEKQVKSAYGNVYGPNDRYGDVGYEDLHKFLEQNPGAAAQYDLVSIRNRRYRQETLSHALDSLHKRAYAYATIHCSICRVKWTDDEDRGTEWDEYAGGIPVPPPLPNW
jgi:hypothetical protein